MVVVVGIDETERAEIVLRHARDEAERRGAELHAVHVFHPPVMYFEVPVDVQALQSAQQRLVWERLDAVLATSPVPSKRVELEGYPPDTLVAYAKEVGASLIVVGTRGRGDFAALVLGSTSHRVLHLASCNVLVITGDTMAER
jgi:nucleotide-binding universal stress UspA family protein